MVNLAVEFGENFENGQNANRQVSKENSLPKKYFLSQIRVMRPFMTRICCTRLFQLC